MLKPNLNVKKTIRGGDGGGYKKGVFAPNNKEKYQGTYPIVYRSSLEYKFMRFLDINEKVVHWGSESVVVNYISPLDGRQHRYFPDFIVKVMKNDGTEVIQLIEIKPSKQTVKPRIAKNRNHKTMLYESEQWAVNQAKWNAAIIFCKSRNWIFKIITEKDLPQG